MNKHLGDANIILEPSKTKRKCLKCTRFKSVSTMKLARLSENNPKFA